MSDSPSAIPKRIGEILVEANLLTSAQVQVALYDQQQFSGMRLGEIFVFRGWLNQQTADFFGDHWYNLCTQDPDGRQPLGKYLCAAGLVDEHCIDKIIEEQYRNGYRFGANAVLLGFIDQKTLDYFLANLFPEKKNEAHYMFNGKQRIMQPQEQVLAEIYNQNKTAEDDAPFLVKLKENSKQKPTLEVVQSDDDISWVG